MYQLVQRGGRIGGVDFRGQVKRVGEVGVGIGAILEEHETVITEEAGSLPSGK